MSCVPPRRLRRVGARRLVIPVAVAVLGAGPAQAAVRAEGPALRSPAPAAVVATSSVRFAWTAAARPGYDLRVARNRAFTQAMQTVHVRRPAARVLLPRGRWFWKVRATGRGRASRWSRTRAVRVVPRRDLIAPGRPGPARLLAVDVTAARLRFGAARDDRRVVGYRILGNGRLVGRSVGLVARLSGLRCGTLYTFAAVAVDAAGNRSRPSPAAHARTRPCGSESSLVVRPSRLAVTGRTSTSVSLAWLGVRGAAGYRIETTGRAASVTATSVTVTGLRCGTAYVFTARTVLRGGAVSAASAPAGARTASCVDTEAPTAPGGLRAAAVSDTAVALAWSPGADPEGNVAGYVVYRNGVELGRPTTPYLTAGRLVAGTAYTFTVLTRDRVGHVSTPAALAVTTAQPVPADGPLHAFLLASVDQAFLDLQAHYRRVSQVYPTYFDVLGDGTIAGRDDPLVTRWAVAHGIKVLPRINNQDPVVLHRLLSDPVRRTKLVGDVVALAMNEGYSGVNIDFEGGYAEDKPNLTAFIQDLARELHVRGRLLSIAVSPKWLEVQGGRTVFFDYPALTAAVDELFVMAWGLHWSTSAAGPMADISWFGQVAAYLDTLRAPGKITLATHFYGFDWPPYARGVSKAKPYEYPDVVALRDRAGASTQWSEAAQEPFFTYAAADGGHEVWYANGRSVQARLALARAHGFGLGAWRLGQEDPEIWSQEVLTR